MTRDEWTGVSQAAAATLCFSTGAPLIRLTADLSPVEVASLRWLLASAFVGAAAWAAGEQAALWAKGWARLVRASHLLANESIFRV